MPELVQFVDLTSAHFVKHPVWIGCHTADYGEPWYDETDDETFRPRSGDLPADPTEGMLVRAAAVLADSSRLDGFLTPALSTDLGTLQPQVFVRGQSFSFWTGIMGSTQGCHPIFLLIIVEPWIWLGALAERLKTQLK